MSCFRINKECVRLLVIDSKMMGRTTLSFCCRCRQGRAGSRPGGDRRFPVAWQEIRLGQRWRTSIVPVGKMCSRAELLDPLSYRPGRRAEPCRASTPRNGSAASRGSGAGRSGSASRMLRPAPPLVHLPVRTIGSLSSPRTPRARQPAAGERCFRLSPDADRRDGAVGAAGPSFAYDEHRLATRGAFPISLRVPLAGPRGRRWYGPGGPLPWPPTRCPTTTSR